jgi:hypothetical protein
MTESTSEHQSKSMSGTKLFLLIFGSVLIALLLAGLLIKWWLFPTAFTPISLSASETARLEYKIEQLPFSYSTSSSKKQPLQPKPYSEKGLSRNVEFSEREINALIAQNRDLAENLVIDFSDNLISAELLVPLDPDFPILGGKTLRVSSGVEFSYQNGRPRVVLQGISVWGVPMPDAWMGNLKQVDLIKEFGGKPGFWKQFAAGVENIEVSEGELKLQLKK